jgi:hypothetical protein
MLRRLSEPLPLSEASLLALRPALNAPVLNVGYLPVGPARAAVVVFAEEYGGIGVALGIRSIEGGQVAVFRNQEPCDEGAPLPESLEPALAEAERMGFLFDEDLVESSPRSGRADATLLWSQLMGDFDAREEAAESATQEEASLSGLPPLEAGAELPGIEEADELVLEDVARLDDLDLEEPIELDLEEVSSPELDLTRPTLPLASPPVESSRTREGAAEKAQAADPRRGRPRVDRTASAPAARPAQKLSKFRHTDLESGDRASGVSESDSDGGGSQLGRIALKRVRAGRTGTRRISYVARLLSSF